MSEALNLVEHLLARGRNLQKLGRVQDARRVLRRITRLEDLPAEAAEETQARLAEIALNQSRYRRARRHLAAALRYHPDNARYYYLMALAIDAEETGDPLRAARYFRRSLQLDANQPRCLLDYGLFHLREGRVQAGVVCLRRAIDLAPDDLDIVHEAARGLMVADQSDEERSILRTSLFRNSRDGRFRNLWNDHEFRRVSSQQAATRLEKAPAKGDEEPVVLKFARNEDDGEPFRISTRTIRHDGPSPLPQPHSPRPANKWNDQRQAR